MNNSPNVSKPAEEKGHLRAAKVSQLTKQEKTGKNYQKRFHILLLLLLLLLLLVS